MSNSNLAIPSIDYNRWREILKKPDWYITLIPEINEQFKLTNGLSEEEKDVAKEMFYGFFEESLAKGEVALGNTGKDFDSERQPIDTAIIHHTSNKCGISSERISAMELIRLYAPYYFEPYDARDISVKGTPIYSGHVRNGQQYFGVYHWIVRCDGSVERWLEDKEIGWQAGNWEINCRSIGIVFDNDYANAIPSDAELEAVGKILTQHYPHIAKERILGHCEVNLKKTTCPSGLFLSTDTQVGWKEKLLKFV